MLIYYDTDTQYANYGGNPLRQATKLDKKTTAQPKKEKLFPFSSHFSSIFNHFTVV